MLNWVPFVSVLAIIEIIHKGFLFKQILCADYFFGKISWSNFKRFEYKNSCKTKPFHYRNFWYTFFLTVICFYVVVTAISQNWDTKYSVAHSPHEMQWFNGTLNLNPIIFIIPVSHANIAYFLIAVIYYQEHPVRFWSQLSRRTYWLWKFIFWIDCYCNIKTELNGLQLYSL